MPEANKVEAMIPLTDMKLREREKFLPGKLSNSMREAEKVLPG